MKKNTMRWFPMRMVHKGRWKEAVVIAIVFVLLSISSCTNTSHTNSGMKSDQENSQLVHQTAVSIKDVPDLPSSSLITEEPYSIVWSYPLGEELRTSNNCTINTVIIQDKNVLFFGVTEQTTHKDYICAFNLDTHSVQWKREIPQVTSYMCVQDTILYVGSMGIFYAFNTNNGDILWQKESEKGWFQNPVVAKGVVYVDLQAYPTDYHGSNLLASESSYFLYAFHALTGEKLWDLSLDFGGMISPPSYNDRMLYFGTYVGNAYAVNADNGEIVWKKELTKFITSKTCYDDSLVYIIGRREANTERASYLYALNAETGDIVWTFTAPDGYENMEDYFPIISEDVLYAYCSNYSRSDQCMLYAIDANTGNEIWSYSIKKLVRKHPVIQGDTIYLSGFALIALDKKTGMEKWEYPIKLDSFQPNWSQGIQSPPHIANNILYFFVDGEEIYYALQDHTL